MIRGIAHGLYFIKIQRLQWLHVDPIYCLHQNCVNDQIDHGDGEHAKHPGAFIKCAAEGLHCRVDQSDGHNLRGLECKEEDTGGSNVNTKQSPLYKGIVFIVAANITNGFYQSEEQNVDGRATNKGCSDIGGKEQHYHRHNRTTMAKLAAQQLFSQNIHCTRISQSQTQGTAEYQLNSKDGAQPFAQQTGNVIIPMEQSGK